MQRGRENPMPFIILPTKRIHENTVGLMIMVFLKMVAVCSNIRG